MVGCLSLFATRYNWLQKEWISEYLLSLFSAMAAFLLCFSLAYRTYLEKKGRMRAKRQASEGLKRYFELYHSANEGLFTSTLEGQLLAANPAFCRMFGYDDIQTMATTVGRLTHNLYVNGKDRDDLLARLFGSTKEGVRSDVELRHKDGTTFWGGSRCVSHGARGRIGPCCLRGSWSISPRASSTRPAWSIWPIMTRRPGCTIAVI